MATNRINFVFRTRFSDVLEREQEAVVRMEIYDQQGRLVVPTQQGSTFQLVDESGSTVVGPLDVVIVDEVGTFTIDAVDLPATLPFGTFYQERWVFILPDGTTRRPRRECAIAPFLLELPVAEEDLMAGKHPDLRELLGRWGNSLWPFIDEAWADILEQLWEVGRWPDLMLSTGAFRKPVMSLALANIFAFLARQTSGANRFDDLKKEWAVKSAGAWARLRSRMDSDIDGLADNDDRVSAQRLHQWNGGGLRRIARTGRF